MGIFGRLKKYVVLEHKRKRIARGLHKRYKAQKRADKRAGRRR